MPKKKTHEEFIVDARNVHGDNYEYPERYENSHKKILIFCKKCDHEFPMKPSNHTNLKQGCPKCGKKSAISKSSKQRRMTQKEFIRRAKENCPELLYDRTVYVNRRTEVEVGCSVHKKYWKMTPGNLLSCKGCPKCVNERVGKSQRLSQEEVLRRLTDAFGDKFDYSKVDFNTTNEEITLICPKKGHGEFPIKIGKVKKGVYGCPHCWNEATRSKNEEHLERILKEKYPYLTIQTNNRSLLEGYEVDIYIPEVKLAIEWNGIYWHSFTKVKKTDAMKKKILGSDLIQILDDGHEDPEFVMEVVEKQIVSEIESRLSQVRDGSLTKSDSVA